MSHFSKIAALLALSSSFALAGCVTDTEDPTVEGDDEAVATDQALTDNAAAADDSTETTDEGSAALTDNDDWYHSRYYRDWYDGRRYYRNYDDWYHNRNYRYDRDHDNGWHHGWYRDRDRHDRYDRRNRRDRWW